MQNFEAETIEQAIQAACEQLGTSQASLNYEIVQAPRRGFLGIGRRSAIIKAAIVTPTPTKEKSDQPVSEKADKPQRRPKPVEKQVAQPSEKENEQIISRENFAKNLAKMKTASQGLQQYLDDVLKALDINAYLEIEKLKAHECRAMIVASQPSQVIGYHGRRINALEELGAAYLTYHGIKDVQFRLNSGDYRERREKALQKLMAESITKVIASNQAVFLDPMPAHERKFLHKLAEKSDKVKTYSHGREPYRSIVIAPKD